MKRLIFISLCLLSVLSCLKENREMIYANQETRIASFLQSKVSDTTWFVNNEGAYRLTLKAGTGEALQSKGTVSFYYGGYVFNGSVSTGNLFVTNHKETAATASWDTSDESRFVILTRSLPDANFVEGLAKGLVGVQSGEHAYIVFSGKYGFGSRIYGSVPPNSALIYEIWVEGVNN
ncbi:MAG: FKBP-type peptidyl-prolyl cis-trans isomerase [Bacteroidales bacterium]|nr:FKBP-type peptidyl-prolyl cis-trans isomerase [Bacteroidales bacterium]